MHSKSYRLLPMAGFAALLLAGCATGTSISAPHLLADMPLFGTHDGFASLGVTVIDSRRQAQDLSDVTIGDKVLFTLTSATNLAAPKTNTEPLLATSSPQVFTSLFSGLRPGTDYQLEAQVYLSTDAAGGVTQNIIRGEGVTGPLTLTAGSATAATVKINSVGTIDFSNSVNSNVVSDFTVVSGDTLTINTGMNSTNNPQVKSVGIAYFAPDGTQRGSTVTTNTISGTTWTVPSLPAGTNTETGTMYVTGYNSTNGGGQAITYKTKLVTVDSPASITPITLD